MKKEIDVAVNYEKVLTEKRTVDLPSSAKYYLYIDDSHFFPRGAVLFAIIPKYKDSINTYLLLEVERCMQKYNDFVPTKDCRQKYWLNDGNSIRKTALDILSGNNFEFKEITENEFKEKRMELLDDYLNNIYS